jgi:hypothetical protein
VLHRREPRLCMTASLALRQPRRKCWRSTSRGRSDRRRYRMVGQGRLPGAAPFRPPGGDLASRQGHRDGGQNRRGWVCRRDRNCFGQPTAQTANQPWPGVYVVPRYGADESLAALIRAPELATGIDNPTERFTIYDGLWISNVVPGEFGLAREIAETFLREGEHGALTTERAVGHYLVVTTCLFEGGFIEAHANLVEALTARRDAEIVITRGQEMRLRSIQLGGHCNSPGQTLVWTAARTV